MATNYKEMAERASTRAKHMAASIWHGNKGKAMSLASGGIGYFVQKQLRTIEFFQNVPASGTTPAKGGAYRVPIALGIAGYLAGKRHHDTGVAMLVLAGYEAAKEYDNQPAKGYDANAGMIQSTPMVQQLGGMPAGALAFSPPMNAGAMFDQTPASGYANAGGDDNDDDA